jgi:hypothetical protein
MYTLLCDRRITFTKIFSVRVETLRGHMPPSREISDTLRPRVDTEDYQSADFGRNRVLLRVQVNKTTKTGRSGGYRTPIGNISILPASVEYSDVSPPIPASSQTPRTPNVFDPTLACHWESRMYKFQR